MPRDLIPDPDPSKREPSLIPGATGVLRARPEDAGFEADFADLVARFSANSGGGLPPDLSADLALEIVLNEVVEQACQTTGATGAAIVLRRGGEMVCRASSGSTAPDLGSRLDTASGLSGACVATRRTQWSDDVLEDTRVDMEASRRLGVRSVMVMPLLHDGELVGIFELFSSLPHAFGARDERTLEVLAKRILSSVDRAAHPLPAEPPAITPGRSAAAPARLEPPRFEPPRFDPAQFEAPAESAPVESAKASPVLSQPSPSHPSEDLATPIEDASPSRGFDFVTWALVVAVIGCAVLLGVLLGRDLNLQKARLRPHPVAPVVATAASSPSETSNDTTVGTTSPSNPAAPPSAPVKPVKPLTNLATAQQDPGQARVLKDHENDPLPVGGLRVFENGKEVFRLPPASAAAAEHSAGSGKSSPQKIVLSPSAAEGSLLHRVEPEYPEAARQQHVQGAVVLDVDIGEDGTVQEVQVVSGPPLLAQASTDAVRQWRFKPRSANGRPAEMQTRVTLNFRLPN